MKSVLVLAPTKELALQLEAELREHYPNIGVGVVCAGLRRFEYGATIVIATPQTYLNRQKRRGLAARDLIIVDEAHRIAPGDETTIRTLIAANDQGRGRKTPVLGLTATSYRLDSGPIYGAPGALFDAMAYRVGVEELVANDWLAPVVAKSPTEKLDVSGVALRAGEFKPGELAAAVDRDEINRRIVAEIVRRGSDRRAWLVFAVNVEHARHLLALLREAGVAADAVFGTTPTPERDASLERFRQGDLTVMVNVDVLTTGFNVRHVDLVAIVRPTMSASLYVQMVGRGTRTAEGKVDCLLLDFGGNVERHGPITNVQTPRSHKDKGDGPPPLKVCPSCDSFVAAGALACPDCGHEWERAPVEEKLDAVASDLDPMAAARLYEVLSISIVPYFKDGKPPSARIVYKVDHGLWLNEWITPQHGGFAGHKARQWWAARNGGRPPKTTKEFVARVASIRHPSAIRSYRDGKFDRIEPERFDDGSGPQIFVRPARGGLQP